MRLSRCLLPGLGALLMSWGCAGPSSGQGGAGRVPAAAMDRSPVAEDLAPLTGAGGRCQGAVCACRPIDESGRGAGADTDAEESPPVEGLKRFELRTGRGEDTMKITVEGRGTFVKGAESVEPGCIYVDLPPGTHRVRYHVIARSPGRGLEARLRISEYGVKHERWYRTFAFRCGSGEEPCTKDDARDAIEALGRVKGGKHDPCGSTKVYGLSYETDRAPESLVHDFSLQLLLHVYKFTPRFAPDEKSCKGVSE